jgi:flavin-dependent dehydrogenase
MDFEQHLIRQMAFSHATFGPGERQQGVIDHIRKELIEVETSNGEASEWVDVVILALDGLTRRLSYPNQNRRDPARVAIEAVSMIIEKQTKNEARVWPDWRTAPAGKAIEHIKVTGAPSSDSE